MPKFVVIREFAWNNFGHCLLCMKRSFIALITSLIITVSLNALDIGRNILFIAIVLNLSCFALWAAHILIYGLKTYKHGGDVSRAAGGSVTAKNVHTRRSAGLIVAKAVGVAIVGSAVTSKAFAKWGDGGIGPCGGYCNGTNPRGKGNCPRNMRPYYDRGACWCFTNSACQ